MLIGAGFNGNAIIVVIVKSLLSTLLKIGIIGNVKCHVRGLNNERDSR